MQTVPSTFQDPDYKRHDFFGWNYRLPEICAAVGLAQVERIDKLVQRRQAVARLFDEAIKGCDWMIPQKTPDGLINSYYTYALRYEGEEALGISWKEFYKKYIDGSDGNYESVLGIVSTDRQSSIKGLSKGVSRNQCRGQVGRTLPWT